MFTSLEDYKFKKQQDHNGPNGALTVIVGDYDDCLDLLFVSFDHYFNRHKERIRQAYKESHPHTSLNNHQLVYIAQCYWHEWKNKLNAILDKVARGETVVFYCGSARQSFFGDYCGRKQYLNGSCFINFFELCRKRGWIFNKTLLADRDNGLKNGTCMTNFLNIVNNEQNQICQNNWRSRFNFVAMTAAKAKQQSLIMENKQGGVGNEVCEIMRHKTPILIFHQDTNGQFASVQWFVYCGKRNGWRLYRNTSIENTLLKYYANKWKEQIYENGGKLFFSPSLELAEELYACMSAFTHVPYGITSHVGIMTHDKESILKNIMEDIKGKYNRYNYISVEYIDDSPFVEKKFKELFFSDSMLDIPDNIGAINLHRFSWQKGINKQYKLYVSPSYIENCYLQKMDKSYLNRLENNQVRSRNDKVFYYEVIKRINRSINLLEKWQLNALTKQEKEKFISCIKALRDSLVNEINADLAAIKESKNELVVFYQKVETNRYLTYKKLQMLDYSLHIIQSERKSKKYKRQVINDYLESQELTLEWGKIILAISVFLLCVAVFTYLGWLAAVAIAAVGCLTWVLFSGFVLLSGFMLGNVIGKLAADKILTPKEQDKLIEEYVEYAEKILEAQPENSMQANNQHDIHLQLNKKDGNRGRKQDKYKNKRRSKLLSIKEEEQHKVTDMFSGSDSENINNNHIEPNMDCNKQKNESNDSFGNYEHH